MIISNPSPKGCLCLVLHAHLPYIRHPEHEFMLEENWLFEAITETYIPLLLVFDNLVNDRIPFRITMSLSPTLCSMLVDPLLQERYVKYIDRSIECAEKECERTKNQPDFRASARMYVDKFRSAKELFVDADDCDILGHFRLLQEKGALEIIASAATHGFFPVMQVAPHAVRAQVRTGVESYYRNFNQRPKGFWLPECGYYPGVEKILDSAGVAYFFTDAHGLLFAEPRPQYGVFAPVLCNEAPVAAFARDIESSKAVWSSREGYPGDFAYREFYRDIGFDLDMKYIRPYIDPIGIRSNTGIKYYKITGKTDHKKPYDQAEALDRALVHAGNFMFNREKQVEYCAALMDRRPIIVAPYDAELFGHWWYEGPDWLNYLIRKMAFEQDTVSLCTPSDYLVQNPKNQVCRPSLSSWGHKGYSEVWLDESNDWMYSPLHIMEELMVDCAKRYTKADGLTRRALNQMARELLLAESSDWAFIMKSGTMVNYARRRVNEHIGNFNRLHDDLQSNRLEEKNIGQLESHNNIFPDIDYRVYV
jgi:1,4-alpha-glucan branching enzyme